MRIEFPSNRITDYTFAADRSWMLTNGLGGYASLTLGGGNVSKYHCLLSAAMSAPCDRYVLCSNIHEIVKLGNANVSLATFDANGMSSQGNQYLKSFVMEYYPTYTYKVDDVSIVKEIVMLHGANGTTVRYTVTTGSRATEISLFPLLNYRPHHLVSHIKGLDFDVWQWPGVVNVEYKGETDYLRRIHIAYTAGEFVENQEPDYFQGMFYRQDANRGCEAWEDHFIPGKFVLKVAPNSTKTVQITVFTEQGSTWDIIKSVKRAIQPDYFAKEIKRKKELYKQCSIDHDRARTLCARADDFYVKDAQGDGYIMAGYPWYGFRGRDAAIALMGMFISTGRLTEAREILLHLGKFVKDGMLVDSVHCGGNVLEYDSADSALWLFEAVFEYYVASGDKELVCEMRPILESIISTYQHGINDGRGVYIAMNSLGLIETSPAMTWMDAKADGKAIIPREGCAVEINGLWYNALRIMEKLCPLWGDEVSRRYDIQAILTRDSFQKYFVYEGGICDCVTFYRTFDGRMEPYRDLSVRCNQLIALGLSFSPCDTDTMKRCVRRMGSLMYTPVGIRTLSPDDMHYTGVCAGAQHDRDYAAYNGNSWMWLQGFYLRLLYRLGMYSKEQVMTMLLPAFRELEQNCVGHGGEMYQGDMPFASAGDWAHALSDAEILRTLGIICENRREVFHGKSKK